VVVGVAVLSVGLGMLALFAFGYPFGFMAIIGIMGLLGVAVNDSIVVLAALRSNQKACAGDREAVVDTVVVATRHLVSTSLTTMAGFAPLVLAGGSFWPPVAVAIGGGVAGATLLAVTFVPTLFVLAHRGAAVDREGAIASRRAGYAEASPA
jgi:multidrug efflux pump subunit AcrB